MSELENSMIGRMIGDYQIVSMLGEGGMGVVFKGVHATLGQMVAIKMLQPDLLKNESVRSRFVREAQALARLNHPNMVSLYNFLDTDDGCFIIMEYTEGKDIEVHMEEIGLITPEVCCEWYDQILSAMGYAHSLNIIHRDIKPSNIMVTAAGPVKVLDFGTAKLLDAPALTKAGMTLGTVIYMSPEQLLGRQIDARSDIYSLGVTLYEMCTGRLPFEDAREIDLVRKIARADPTPPTAHYPYLPKPLEDIILKAMSKKSEDRYQTADEFAIALRQFHMSLKGGAPAQPVMPNAPITNAVQQVSAMPPPEMPQTMGVSASGEVATGGGGGGGGIFLGAAAGLLIIGVGAGLGLYFGVGNGVLAGAIGGLFVLLALGAGIVGLMKMSGGGGGRAPVAAAPQSGMMPMPQQPMPMPQQPQPGFAPPAGGGGGGFLFIMEGNDKGQKYPLVPEGITMGRGEQNAIPLNDPGVSTVHAQVVLEGNQYMLRDLGSRNGCYLNNQKVTQQPLNHNDIIVLGNTMMMVNLT